MDSATLLATIVGIIWNLLVFRKVMQVWEKLYGNEPIHFGMDGGEDGKRIID
jgi:hypothetical protein